MGYTYAGIELQITRRCNLACPHCYCGEPQDVDMSEKVIDHTFECVSECDRIVIIGGEALLKIDLIDYIVGRILESGCKVRCIAIGTNGTILDEKVIEICKKFCEAGEDHVAEIIVSSDRFHPPGIGERAIEYYDQLASGYPQIIVKSGLSVMDITVTGRAVDLVKNRHFLEKDGAYLYYPYSFGHQIKVFNDCVFCEITVGANGNVSLEGTLSFQEFDAAAFGNILDKDLNELIDGYNEKCLLRCEDETFLNSALALQNFPINKVLGARNKGRVDMAATMLLRGAVISRVIDCRATLQRLFPGRSAAQIILHTSLPKLDLIIKRAEKLLPPFNFNELLKLSKRLTPILREELVEYVHTLAETPVNNWKTDPRYVYITLCAAVEINERTLLGRKILTDNDIITPTKLIELRDTKAPRAFGFPCGLERSLFSHKQQQHAE